LGKRYNARHEAILALVSSTPTAIEDIGDGSWSLRSIHEHLCQEYAAQGGEGKGWLQRISYGGREAWLRDTTLQTAFSSGRSTMFLGLESRLVH
jgi:hypothetical protein